MRRNKSSQESKSLWSPKRDIKGEKIGSRDGEERKREIGCNTAEKDRT